MTIILANLADLCTFLLVVQIHPISGESNPLAATLWTIDPWLLVAAKVAGVIAVLLIVRHLHGWTARVGVGLAVAVPVLGMAANTLSGFA